MTILLGNCTLGKGKYPAILTTVGDSVGDDTEMQTQV